MEFRLPELGEGIDSATVVGVLVKPGDVVKAGQSVLAIETDKAAVEVPAEADCSVEAVHVKPGDKVPVGQLLFTLRPSGAAGEVPRHADPQTKKEVATTPQPPEYQTSKAGPGVGSAEFRLPELGEGIDAATVVGVLVKPGDAVKAGQGLLSIETDKAAAEVPAEADGTVAEVHVKPGDKVPVGGLLLTFTTGAAAPRDSTLKSQPVPKPVAASSGAAPTTKASPPDGKVATPAPSGNGAAAKAIVPAGPATRRLARELGLSLSEVNGSGRGGRVTLDDVKGFVREERLRAKTAPGGVPAGKTVADSFEHPPLPDFAKFGEVERKPFPQIRQTIARNLTVAWRTMPMVTQHDLADITELEAGRKRIVEELPRGGAKVTWTVLAVKGVVAALKEFPHFNGSLDLNAGELVLKKYFHVGIAVDTERGLVVPVIRDADKKTVRDIAAEVAGLAEKARAGKLTIDEMRGGTFTITNLGGIGGTAFTPIVNYPEVAILGLSRSSWQPVVRDGQVVPRLMLPLSLTYDHRVIDGADGARFTTRLAQLFSDPIRLLMES
jgi:pyruvate dehydrogenase E2 component (dihydrolipoamide acetyltransferase)